MSLTTRISDLFEASNNENLEIWYLDGGTVVAIRSNQIELVKTDKGSKYLLLKECPQDLYLKELHLLQKENSELLGKDLHLKDLYLK